MALNLAQLPVRYVSEPASVTLITAPLFGSIHLPDMWLFGATFALGLVLTPMYLRWRNIWPIGIIVCVFVGRNESPIYSIGFLHGWLGAFFYYLVLQRVCLCILIVLFV